MHRRIAKFLLLTFAFSIPLWVAASALDATHLIPIKLPLSALQFLIVFGAAVVVFVVSVVILFPRPQFPKPTGPYAVGTRTYRGWIDATRRAPFAADPDNCRELVVQIWYPTNAPGPRQRYIENHATLVPLAARFHLPSFLLRNVERAPTHSTPNAVAADGRFPVLLNPTGFSGFRNASLFWIEELVSHGYVIVGMDQPGTATATVLSDGSVMSVMASKAEFDHYMPLALSHVSDQTPIMNGVPLPGGIIPFLAQDLRFVLDKVEALDRDDPVLAGHVDIERAGVFGMSLGAYVGPEACYLDPRLRACVAVDAGKTARVVREGLQQPLMIITRDADVIRQERVRAGGWPEPEITHTIDDQRNLFERSRGDSYYVTMNRMYHINWTDAPLWSPLVRWVGLAGPIDPYVGFGDTNHYTLAFFDHYLKGRPSPLLQREAQPRADLRLEVRLRSSAATRRH